MQDFVYALLMVQSSYRQAIQKSIRDLGINITFEMLQVMRYLYHTDNINQQELANQIFKDKSSLSYLLNNMEKRSLITRIEDNNDKRNKLIALTDHGKKIHEEIKSAIEAIYKRVEKNIDSEKLNVCIKNMKELSEIISNE